VSKLAVFFSRVESFFSNFVKPNLDVVIINTVEATKEQVEKARQFKLPDNFYLYEKCQDCKGCRGCEKD
jgi:hypothetical protein